MGNNDALRQRYPALADFPRFAAAARATGLSEAQAQAVLEEGLRMAAASGPDGPDHWVLLRHLMDLRAEEMMRRLKELGKSSC